MAVNEQSRIADVRPGQAPLVNLPDLALGPVLIVAGLLGALLVAFSDRYGYHRDELYFLQCGRHLALGFPDQPPLVPVIARLMSDLAPGSLVLLRLPSALAAAAVVVLTAMITRELGGHRTAQILAAGIIALAPVTLGSSHLLSTTAFDLPAWALLCLLLIRILRTGNSRLWLLAGLVAGIGLLDTDLVTFLIFAVVVGLIAAGPRQPLRSPWFYAGGAIALGLWAPYLAWQAAHGWPELKVAHSIATGGSGTSAQWWLILPEQLILVSPYFAPVWIAWPDPVVSGTALVPGARSGLPSPGRRVHAHWRQAVLPGRDVPGTGRRRRSAGRRLAGTGGAPPPADCCRGRAEPGDRAGHVARCAGECAAQDAHRGDEL